MERRGGKAEGNEMRVCILPMTTSAPETSCVRVSPTRGLLPGFHLHGPRAPSAAASSSAAMRWACSLGCWSAG